MLRTTVLSTALLGLTLLVPTSASGAGETCQGQPATLVGAPATFSLTGTEGPDVIVTNGSMQVDALGGNDLVCVTVRGAGVQAGDGDDVVDTTAVATLPSTAYLGAGSDRFVGGPEVDVVYAGAAMPGSEEMTDTERDVIDAGPETSSPFTRDRVISGQRGLANGDAVHVDRGIVSWSGIATDTTVLDGGASSSLAVDTTGAESVRIDNVGGTLAVDLRPVLRFSGFTRFDRMASVGLRTFSFRGSDLAETVSIDVRDTGTHLVFMGGGDDTVSLYGSGVRSVAAGSTYRGGEGRDGIELTLPDEVDADLHLTAGRLTLGPRQGERSTGAKDFEDARVMAERVDVVGTSKANRISVYACRARVDGRSGKDRIDTFDNDVTDESLRCDGVRATFLGGDGRDTLVGTRGRDRLIGGQGRDKADGGKGRDFCRAEVCRSCEKRT